VEKARRQAEQRKQRQKPAHEDEPVHIEAAE
jgi:hypothetical protein